MMTVGPDQPCNRDWSSLHEDILRLILSKNMYMIDIHLFRAVCKQWRSVEIPERSYLTESGSQYLMQKSQKKSHNSTVRLIHPLWASGDPRNIDVHIPGLSADDSILFNKEGWLLMSGESGLFLANIVTKSLIRLPDLPDLPESDRFAGFTFTSNPTSKDCLVFAVKGSSTDNMAIFMTSCGEGDTWKQIEINRDKDNSKLAPSLLNPFYYQGKLHILCKGGEFVTYDPCNNNWTILKGLEKYHRLMYVLEFNGKLICVHVKHWGDISICRWDESVSNWSKDCIEDLGDYALFLSDTTCFAAKCIRACMKNKIYFPVSPKGYGGSIFFCLKNCRFQTFETIVKFETITKGLDAKTLVNSSWIDVPK